MWRICLLLAAGPAFSDSLVATRAIRALTTITADDVTLVDAAIEGAEASPGDTPDAAT